MVVAYFGRAPSICVDMPDENQRLIPQLGAVLKQSLVSLSKGL